MSEPPDADRGPGGGDHRRRYGDVRDDYDDDFGKVRTPAQLARRKLVIPAIAILITGSLGIAVAIFGAGAVLVNTFDDAQDELDVILAGFFVLLIVFGGCLFGLVAAGGLGMLHLRQRGQALAAAYIVTALSLAGPYGGFLFYPFGIWALVLLHNPVIKVEFDKPKTPVKGGSIKIADRSGLLLLLGGIGLPASLFFIAGVAWDAAIAANWTGSELGWCIGLGILGASLSATAIVFGFRLNRKTNATAQAPEPLEQ